MARSTLTHSYHNSFNNNIALFAWLTSSASFYVVLGEDGYHPCIDYDYNISWAYGQRFSLWSLHCSSRVLSVLGYGYLDDVYVHLQLWFWSVE